MRSINFKNSALLSSGRRILALALIAVPLLGLLFTEQALGQTWPAKPIKLIVGFPPGGGIDIVARNLQPGLQEALGQSVIIEYKPGAGGVLAASELSRTTADGYTLLVANIGPFILASNMMSKRPFDSTKDFSWISQTSGSGFVAVVPANHPANNLAEFVAWAKANADKANYASGGSGSITHLNGELLNQITGLRLVHVPYKGSAPAVQDLIGGQTQLLVDVASVLLPHIQSGKLKAIYVTDSQRQPQLPNVATAREAGYPGLETSGWQGIVGPAGIPKEIVNKIAKAVQATLARPEVRQRFAQTGSNVMERGPEEFNAFIASEINRWVPVIKASGAKLD
ncbi:MAG: Bug family tripartite tricarboxylate transporter substrate binding protein [Hylemonella sp.]|jgi:tripartite-type tricarboxylate transporter receptor subunit TctC